MKNATISLLATLALSCGPAATERFRIAAPTTAAQVDGDAPESALAEVPGRAPTPDEARAMAELLRLAEEIRDLRFEHEVPFRVQSREAITQFVRGKIEPEELERSRIFYVAIGLLDPALDAEEMVVSVLGEQILGYYDPERSLMVVREDIARQLGRARLDRALGEAEMIIVHELVHALQDQRLALGEHYALERTIDADNAFASLVEGDATLAMIGHLVSRAGQPLEALTQNSSRLQQMLQAAPPQGAGEALESAPAIMRVPLLSRYIDGMVFCATLHGQQGWLAVDDAHARLPVSTEQVLHPERYFAGDAPVEITIPELPELARDGWTPHDEDTLGELEMSIWFAQRGSGERGRADDRSPDRDERAAEGWGGDRLRVYRNAEGDTAVVWFTIWDDVAEAREAEAAARVMSADQSITRDGRALLILRDLPADLHPPVREAFRAFAAGAR